MNQTIPKKPNNNKNIDPANPRHILCSYVLIHYYFTIFWHAHTLFFFYFLLFLVRAAAVYTS